MRTHFLILTALLFFASSMFVVHAQIDYIPLAPLPNTIEAGKTTTSLPTYLTGLYKTGIAAAGILAVLMLVWGGFQYMTTEAVQGKSESKGIIQNVMWGLATVLASYLLLYTINPRLVDIGLAIGSLNAVKKTVIPSAADTYGKFLDDALNRAKNISTKAKELKAAAGPVQARITEIERKLREGDFTPEEIANLNSPGGLEDELNTLKPKLQELQIKEILVRSYEGAKDYLSINMRTQINRCLVGEGACSVPGDVLDQQVDFSTWSWSEGFPVVEVTVPNKDKAANIRTVNNMLASAQAKVDADVKKLEGAKLFDQAADLKQSMQNIKDETAFYVTCPNSKAIYRRGMVYASGNCPP